MQASALKLASNKLRALLDYLCNRRPVLPPPAAEQPAHRLVPRCCVPVVFKLSASSSESIRSIGMVAAKKSRSLTMKLYRWPLDNDMPYMARQLSLATSALFALHIQCSMVDYNHAFSTNPTLLPSRQQCFTLTLGDLCLISCPDQLCGRCHAQLP